MTDAVPIHDAAELTRYIETRYHARHREQLPRRAKLAEMVEDLHFGDEGVPHGLSDLLHRMIGEMGVHMKKEELVVFSRHPPGRRHRYRRAYRRDARDHDGHHRELAEIRRLTHDLTPPERACTSWCTLYSGLGEFVDDLMEHIRLENDVLFPRFEKVA